MQDLGSDFSAAFNASFAGLQVEVREAYVRESEAARVLTGDTARDQVYGSASVKRLTTTFAEAL